MSTSLKIKAILQEEGVESSNPEIRRFSVDVKQGENSEDFHSLLTTVQSFFNLSARDTAGSCTLFWKDEDGDLVQFSTIAELRHAMENMYDDTLRIYVSVTNDHAEATEANAQDSESEEEDKNYPDDRETPFPFFTSPIQDSHPNSWQWPSGMPPPFMGPGRHCGRKGKKMMKMMWKQRKMATKGNKVAGMFHTLRLQVPATFRFWVRKYVRTWFTQGADAAAAMTKSIPEGAPPGFQQWLDNFLRKWTGSEQTGKASGGSDMENSMEEDQLPEAPEGLPPVYYQWLRHFLLRFTHRQAGISSWGDSEEGEDAGWLRRRHRHFHKHGFHHGKKHCKHWKKGRHSSSSSDSDDSDSGRKLWKNVPKEFRKYVRVTVKHLHKNKGDNLKIKEKATRAGLSAEVLEFVQQVLLEWQAKLSGKRPRHVAREMMEGERTLPPGLQKEHFEWLCRFVARWHLRHARKCDVMAGWSSEETTSASSEDEETTAEESRPWPAWNRRQFWASLRAMRGHAHGLRGHSPAMRVYPPALWGHPAPRDFGMNPGMHGHPHGMRGHPPHHFGMNPGMHGHPPHHFGMNFGMHGHPPHHFGMNLGMHGHPPHHFGMNPRMANSDFPYVFPSHQIQPHFDNPDMPFGPERLMCPGLMMGFGGMSPEHTDGCGVKRGSNRVKAEDCKRRKDQDDPTSSQANYVTQEEIEHVTDRVRKL